MPKFHYFFKKCLILSFLSKNSENDNIKSEIFNILPGSKQDTSRDFKRKTIVYMSNRLDGPLGHPGASGDKQDTSLLVSSRIQVFVSKVCIRT